ncbi:MAG: fibronectin type III domain-containing protein [Acidobacteriota bacterium]|nr:fibronectin type III domain-containing protein [Acidobacteriota bacterium]
MTRNDRHRSMAGLAATALVAAGLLAGVGKATAGNPAPVWTAASTLTPAGGNDPILGNDRIDVAMGKAGDAAVGWLSGMANSNGPGTVTVSYRPGQGGAAWQTSNLTTGAVAITEPRVAVGGNGDAVIAWEQADGLYAAYRPAGATSAWTAPQEIAPSLDYAQCGYGNCPENGASVAIDDSGNAIIGWGRPNYGQTWVAPMVAYRPAGATSAWSAPEAILDSTGNPPGRAGDPQVAFDGAGNAVVVYSPGAQSGCFYCTAWGVAVADRTHDTGAFGTNHFGNSQIVDAPVGEQPSLDLAVGSNGSVALAWSHPSGASYLAYRPAGQPSFDAAANYFGTVSVDTAGDAIAVEAGYDYFHPAGTGQSWTAVPTGPFVPRGTYTDQYVPMDVALDSTGQAVVVGTHTDLRTYQSGTSAAVRHSDGTWSTVSELTSTSDSASSQRVATDGQGDGIAAWVEAVNGNDVVRVAGLVGGLVLGPVLSLPAAFQGDPATFSVGVGDVWNPVLDSSVTWTFTNASNPADQTTATGPTVSHTFTSTGTYQVSVTATDSTGGTATSTSSVTVTVPDATLSADHTSGIAPLTVALDASGSSIPPGATFAYYCGDGGTATSAGPSATSATCTYERGSPAGGWGAYVVMHDPASGKDYQATVDVNVNPPTGSVDSSTAFTAAAPDATVTVAADGSLQSTTCGPLVVKDTACVTLDGSTVLLTAAPGTFAAGTQVSVFHGDATTLQSELGPNVQSQGGFAVAWTPAVNLTQPLVVTIDTATATSSATGVHAQSLSSFFSGLIGSFESGAAQVATTIGNVVAATENAISSWWQGATQSINTPNGSSTNNVLFCASVSHQNGTTVCNGPFTELTGVPTQRISALNAGDYVIAAGGGNVIAAGAGNVIAAGGGNVIAAGGGNLQITGASVIAAGGGNVIAAGAGNVIAAGAGNVIAAGAGNVIAAGGGNMTVGLTSDPGFAFAAAAQATTPTVTASTTPGAPSAGPFPYGTSVRVHLSATGSNGVAIQNVNLSTSGAETIPYTLVAGSTADLVIDQPGTTTVTYSARDADLNDAPTHTFTVDISPPAPASAPTAVSATKTASNAVTVSWQTPSDPGGAAITGYTVKVLDTSVPGSSPQSYSFTTTTTTEDITGLTSGHTYVFTVAAFNGGLGAESQESNPILAGTPTTPGGSTAGYRLIGSDGGVFALGGAGFFGSGGGRSTSTVVAAASTPDGRGYWTVNQSGTVAAFGDAHLYGDLTTVGLRAPVVGLASTPDGAGYWVATADGGVFTFGDASFLGSLGNAHLNAPIVGIATTPDGTGYWLTAADGGIFAFGHAAFLGSLGATHLNAPIVGIATTPDGTGYWLTAADGGIFTFGHASFLGSLGNAHLNAPIVGIATTPDGTGYWLTAADGGIFTFGHAAFLGSLGATHLNAPIVAVTVG